MPATAISCAYAVTVVYTSYIRMFSTIWLRREIGRRSSLDHSGAMPGRVAHVRPLEPEHGVQDQEDEAEDDRVDEQPQEGGVGDLEGEAEERADLRDEPEHDGADEQERERGRLEVPASEHRGHEDREDRRTEDEGEPDHEVQPQRPEADVELDGGVVRLRDHQEGHALRMIGRRDRDDRQQRQRRGDRDRVEEIRTRKRRIV